jgi:DNA-binding Lrp family transcriptional regulator
VRLGAPDEDRRITALMLVAVEGNTVEDVLARLRADPAVAALHTTNGRWDVIAHLRADSLEEFDRVLGRIRRIEGIATSETNLLLSTFKY